MTSEEADEVISKGTCNCEWCATGRWWANLKATGTREQIIEFTEERLNFFIQKEEQEDLIKWRNIVKELSAIGWLLVIIFIGMIIGFIRVSQ